MHHPRRRNVTISGWIKKKKKNQPNKQTNKKRSHTQKSLSHTHTNGEPQRYSWEHRRRRRRSRSLFVICLFLSQIFIKLLVDLWLGRVLNSVHHCGRRLTTRPCRILPKSQYLLAGFLLSSTLLVDHERSGSHWNRSSYSNMCLLPPTKFMKWHNNMN